VRWLRSDPRPLPFPALGRHNAPNGSIPRDQLFPSGRACRSLSVDSGTGSAASITLCGQVGSFSFSHQVPNFAFLTLKFIVFTPQRPSCRPCATISRNFILSPFPFVSLIRIRYSLRKLQSITVLSSLALRKLFFMVALDPPPPPPFHVGRHCCPTCSCTSAQDA